MGNHNDAELYLYLFLVYRHHISTSLRHAEKQLKNAFESRGLAILLATKNVLNNFFDCNILIVYIYGNIFGAVSFQSIVVFGSA